MNKKINVLSSFLFAGALLLTSCNFNFKKNKEEDGKKDKEDEESSERISSDWEVIPENTNPNLKYFGFYHPDGFISEPSMLEEIDSLDFCNFYLLNSGVSVDTLLERLDFVKSKGAKCTVGIPSSIYNVSETETYGNGKLHTLKDGWKDIIKNFASKIKSYLEDGTIYAWYSDEPAWNGIKENEFVTVTKFLSEEYPLIGRMACFATAEVGISVSPKIEELNASYFEYLTDVSYDNYGEWDDALRQTYLAKLKSKLTKNQWIWATPRTFEDNPERTSAIIASLKGFYTEAIQDKRYRGFSCFSWSNGFDGDWGYGAKSMVLETSDYYQRSIHALMSDIGRTIQGKQLIDWENIPVLTLSSPREVYNVGEEVPLPNCGAVDSKGNDLDVSLSLKSPEGSDIDISGGLFIPEEPGNYLFTVSTGEGENIKTQTCYISVRYPDEISLFENEAYIGDAGGSDESYWCWPRAVVTDFSHSGSGCLKIMPHEKDGTWPQLTFNRDGNNLWDISGYAYISMWVYNPSDYPLNGMGLMFKNEYEIKESTVYCLKDIPSKEWTNIVAEVDSVAGNELIDLTKVVISFGNCAADYVNRTQFFIDDVVFYGERKPIVTEETTIGFEVASDLEKMPTPSDADAWCWPRGISAEQSHGGNRSLKITPHPTDGQWARVNFGEYDLSNINKVELWAYFDSDNAYDFFALMFSCTSEPQFTYTKRMVSRTWTLYEVYVNDLEFYVDDLTKVQIYFGNAGPDYPDRSPIYLDSFNLVEGRETPELDEVSLLSFDTPALVAALPTPTEDDAWCWPRAFTSEKKHDGAGSLKITPHPTDGTWAVVDLGNFDLSNKTTVELWVYLDSDTDYEYFALQFDKNRLQVCSIAVARTWVKFEASVEAISAAVDDITNVNVKFGNIGGGYTDRSNLYLDSFNIL